MVVMELESSGNSKPEAQGALLQPCQEFPIPTSGKAGFWGPHQMALRNTFPWTPASRTGRVLTACLYSEQIVEHMRTISQ